ncbi:hypothetical protein PILCRDRAFT_821934 [Piloderma croceum F 1598]|uniref:Uncharacterized protein n=1 Tax=Piloderma croceum (strain F 1598) TaxID=765440 RepID=A0A0C3B4J6_PILCF|nr:hypothetical protein PILCRDRAFT_821934 [Piloderma croceum F 1598]
MMARSKRSNLITDFSCVSEFRVAFAFLVGALSGRYSLLDGSSFFSLFLESQDVHTTSHGSVSLYTY